MVWKKLIKGLLALTLLLTPAYAGNFIVRNITNPSQYYFVVNGTTGDVFVYQDLYLKEFTYCGKLYIENGKVMCGSDEGTRGSGTPNYVAYWVNESYLGSTNIYYDSSNKRVGVDTSSPQAKLDVMGNLVVGNSGNLPNGVVGELHVGRQLASAGTAGEATRIAIQPYGHTGGPWKIVARDDSSNAYLDLRYGGTNLLTIIHNGNVGIGTNSPTEKLEVAGNIKAKNIYLNQGQAEGSIYNVDIIKGYNDIRFRLGTNSYFYFQDSAGNTKAWIDYTGNAYFSSSAKSPKFYVSPSGHNTMWIHDTGDIFFIPPYRHNILARRLPYKVEYYNGSSWVEWTGVNFEYWFDNRYDTGITVDYTHRKFRLYFSGMSWRCPHALVIHRAWTKYINNGTTITIETSTDGSTWTVRYQKTFTTFSGYQAIIPVYICVSDGYWRITFDIAFSDTDGTWAIREIELLTFRSDLDANNDKDILVDYNRYFQQHLIPSQNITYDIGSPSLWWRNAYVQNLYVSNINDGNPVTGSGSPGQVAFFTGANTITGDNNLYWDNTNKRLGIGTTSPAYKLDVSGDIRATGKLYLSGAVNTPTRGYAAYGGSPNSTIISFPIISDSNDNAFIYVYQSGTNDIDVRLYLQDDEDDSERFSIWGGSCAHGGCSLGTANAVVQWYVTASGKTWQRGPAYVPKIYDKDDTGYYIDPASTSKVNTLQITNVPSISDNNKVLTVDSSGTVSYIDTSSWDKDPTNEIQNVFTKIGDGSTFAEADNPTDNLTLKAGTGISISVDATNDVITISNTGDTNPSDDITQINVQDESGTTQFTIDSTNNYIQFASGSGISISFDPSNNRVTVKNTGMRECQVISNTDPTSLDCTTGTMVSVWYDSNQGTWKALCCIYG